MRRNRCFWIGRRPIPDNGRFHSRIRENGPHGETKGTRLKGTQLRLNSVDPAVFTHTGVARGPVRVLSVSSSSRSLTPRATPSTVSTSYPLSLLRLSFLPSSLGRVLRETLFSFFYFLILSSLSFSLSFFFHLSFSYVAEPLALQVSAAPTSREGGVRGMLETSKERNRSRPW